MFVGGDLAQDTAHDLPRAGLGQARRPLNEIGRGDGADLLAHPVAQFAAQRFAGLRAGDQRHIHINAGTLDIVRTADRRRFGDLGMRDHRALDFRRSEPMAGDVEHVVDAAR